MKVSREKKQEGLGWVRARRRKGRRHVENSDTADMINEFTEI